MKEQLKLEFLDVPCIRGTECKREVGESVRIGTEGDSMTKSLQGDVAKNGTCMYKAIKSGKRSRKAVHEFIAW